MGLIDTHTHIRFLATHAQRYRRLLAGITEENLDKLLSHALIPMERKNLITNMQHLNLQIIQDQNRVRCRRRRLLLCSLFAPVHIELVCSVKAESRRI